MAITWKGMSAPAPRGVFSAMAQAPKLGLQSLGGITDVLDGIQADNDSGEVLKFKELINSARTPEELDGLMAQINTMRGGMGNASKTSTVDAVKNLRGELINTRNAEEERVANLDAQASKLSTDKMAALSGSLGTGGPRGTGNSGSRKGSSSTSQGSMATPILNAIKSVYGEDINSEDTEMVLTGFNNVSEELRGDLRFIPPDVLTQIITEGRDDEDSWSPWDDGSDKIQKRVTEWLQRNAEQITTQRNAETAATLTDSMLEEARTQELYKMYPDLAAYAKSMRDKQDKLKARTGRTDQQAQDDYIKKFIPRNYHSSRTP